MRSLRPKTGPFLERPYYTDTEIETTCINELAKVNLMPIHPKPIRIDRFIEKRFGVTPDYADLGKGILGLTKFGSNGVREVIVARALEDEGTKPAERRIRSTLAHEAGHGILHAHLFVLGYASQPLFGDYSNPAEPKVLCREIPGEGGVVRSGYDGKWWEFQANRMIGGLLMPKPLVATALEAFLIPHGTLGIRRLDPERRDESVGALADTFDVNPAVAKIRVNKLYPDEDGHQLTF